MGRYGSIPSHNVLKRRKSGSGRAGRGAEAAFLGVNFTGGVPQSLRGGWLGSGSYPPADDVMRLFAPGQNQTSEITPATEMGQLRQNFVLQSEAENEIYAGFLASFSNQKPGMKFTPALFGFPFS